MGNRISTNLIPTFNKALERTGGDLRRSIESKDAKKTGELDIFSSLGAKPRSDFQEKSDFSSALRSKSTKSKDKNVFDKDAQPTKKNNLALYSTEISATAPMQPPKAPAPKAQNDEDSATFATYNVNRTDRSAPPSRPLVARSEFENEDEGSQEVPTENQVVPLRPETLAQMREAQKTGTSENTEAPAELSPEQRAIQKFLKSMQIEMGVKPTEILEAFSKLDESQLQASPQATVEEVIQNLKIQPTQKERARDLYGALVQETEILNQDQISENVQLSLLSPEQAKQKDILNQIGTLNKNFFPERIDRKSDEKQVAVLPPDLDSLPSLSPEQKSDLMALRAQSQQMSGRIQYEKAESAGNPYAAAAASNSPLNMASPELAIANANPAFDFAQMAESNAFESGIGEQTEFPGADESVASVTSAPQPQVEIPVIGTANANSDSSQKDSGSKEKDGFKRDSKLEAGAMLSPIGPQNKEFFVKDAASTVAAPSGEQKDKNVQQLVTGAQVLVRQGGGLMKVQLNPEGLGTVDLRVDVRNGKVDIQMVTDSKEAKKILEDGLDSLRQGLAGHRLSLDTVKVDVDPRSNNEFRQHNFDQGREMAREFLQQFRQGNQSRRDGFFDSLAAASGTQSNNKKTMAPVAAANRSREDRRLDLVA